MEFLINIHAAQTRRQTVVEESFSLSPQCQVTLNASTRLTGNRIVSFNAMPSEGCRALYGSGRYFTTAGKPEKSRV